VIDPVTLPAGEVVAGRYQVERLAGRGGMGEVYRAIDLVTAEPVAMKILRAQSGRIDEEVANRFNREARLLADLRHPGIVRYVAHGQTAAGMRYLIMEWLEGETLAERLAREGLATAEVVRLSLRAAESLGEAHALGIVHRDIKPSNLFLPGGDPTRVRILDFGIARVERMEERSTRLTLPGGVVGTPGYMAPEQVRGMSGLDARVDVFALGCVIFECLAGRPAFQAATPIALIAKVVLEDAPRLSELGLSVPAGLDDLVAVMLAKDRDQRPATARQVAQVLAELGPLPETAARPRGAPPSVLTNSEQRLITVIMAGPVTGSDGELEAASASQGVRPDTSRDDGATAATISLDIGEPPEVAALRQHAELEPPTTQLEDAELQELHRLLGMHQPAGESTRTLTLQPELAPGPEQDLAAEEAAIVERLREVARAHGAELEHLSGGMVVATLGGHASAIDQASRSARCALALGAGLGPVPIALCTGHSVVGDRLPVGEVIERAARLLRMAPAHEEAMPAGGGIRVDDVTAGLLGATFQMVRGPRFVLLRGERHTGEVARHLPSGPTPFQGRERELATLLALYDESTSEPVARAVVVLAPSGTGKSRLRQELLSRLGWEPGAADGRSAAASNERPVPQVWIGRGDPLSAGSPFGLIAQCVRWTARLAGQESVSEQRLRLRHRLLETTNRLQISGRSGLAGDPLDERVGFICEMLGLSGEDSDPGLQGARIDPRLLGDRMRHAFLEWLTAECQTGPLVLVLEDLHWGDGPSVNFIDEALRLLRDQPLFVLALARPEVTDIFPALWAERDAQMIRLGGLNPRACERLVKAVLGRSGAAPPGPEVVRRVVELSGGNAFYLEELARTVGEGRGSSLPGTVLAMVTLRLEALPSQARRVLRAAAIFGERFWDGGLTHLIGQASPTEVGTLHEWLDFLVDRELILATSQPRYAGQHEFVFRHALLREGAYASLTPEDRRLGHRLASDWLTAVGERDPVLLAEHFERGGEPGRALEHYRRAAEQALEGNDLAGVSVLVERAVGCGARDEPLGVLRQLEAEARLWRGDHQAARRFGEEAMALLPRSSPRWYRAAAATAEALGRDSHLPGLTALARELLSAGGAASAASVGAWSRMSAQLIYAGDYETCHAFLDLMDPPGAPLSSDPAVRARAHEARASRAYLAGDAGAYCEHMEAYVAQLAVSGDARSQAFEMINLGDAYTAIGDHERAERLIRQSLHAVDRLGLQQAAAVARSNHGQVLTHLGRYDEAEALLRASLYMGERMGSQRHVGSAYRYLARLRLWQGQLESAEKEAQAAVELLTDQAPMLATSLAVLAEVRLARQNVAGALEAATRAQQLLEELGGVEEGESLIQLVYALALEATGATDEAARALSRAHRRLMERAERISDPELRRGFLERVPEHAAILARTGPAP
jgi:serine/threonine protein kinase/tetratricopeptide (TPR) repeat protein